MKAAQLRQAVLQAAVQGKLVPQNLHDEPASALLKHIQTEKVLLAKEGKIKKEKPLPLIEEDEISYDLPSGWEWGRLGELVIQNTGGGTPSKSVSQYWNGDIPWASVKDISGKLLYATHDFITQKGLENSSSNLIPADTVIVCTRMGLGKICINTIPVAINQDLRALTLTKFISKDYFINFYQSLSIVGSGMTVKGISIDELHRIPFPLPPFAEQRRIVAKVTELMSLCDELEAAEKDLDALESNLSEYLPKSILQAAVQGKLVPQSIHDEPASELLKRIQSEKAKLIKDGKIKKEKPLLPISEEEMPYDLPDGWEWCRLGEFVIQNIGGGTPSKSISEYWNGDIPWASVKDLSGKYLHTTRDFITLKGLTNSSSNLIPEDTVIVCTRMGLGKICINTKPVAINQDLRALMLTEFISKDYFINFYRSLSIEGNGMTVKGISIDELHHMPFPLPPLAEQRRIVAKVDELMALCGQLKNIDTNALPQADTQKFLPPLIMPEPVEAEEQYAMAARGDVSATETAEHRQAMEDLFGDGVDG